jgi:hypothetical protein
MKKAERKRMTMKLSALSLSLASRMEASKHGAVDHSNNLNFNPEIAAMP